MKKLNFLLIICLSLLAPACHQVSKTNQTATGETTNTNKHFIIHTTAYAKPSENKVSMLRMELKWKDKNIMISPSSFEMSINYYNRQGARLPNSYTYTFIIGTPFASFEQDSEVSFFELKNLSPNAVSVKVELLGDQSDDTGLIWTSKTPVFQKQAGSYGLPE